jgi:RES domain-containing protein
MKNSSPQKYFGINPPTSFSRKTLSARLSEADLPANWKDFPHPPATQKVGNEFVRQNQYAVLFIPSAVTQGEYNVLLNPHHRDFAQIKICNIEKFPFDKRIFT